MITVVAYWLTQEASPHITEVQLTYPVTGHSYIPHDCIFGHIEKVIKRKEVVVTAEEF